MEKRQKRLGRFFLKMREESGFTRAEVAANIISEKELEDFEEREIIPNRLVLNTLIQRVGKTPDYMNTIISKQEYEYFKWRIEILTAIQNDTSEEIDWESEQASDRKIHENLQKQFVEFWKGYVEKNTQNMEKAISLTVKGYQGGIIRAQCISTEEIKMLLLCLEQKFKHSKNNVKQKNLLKQELKQVFQYIDRCLQEEEQLKVYERVVNLYGTYMEDIEPLEKYIYYKKGYDLFRRKAYLKNLDKILEGLIREGERAGIPNMEECKWNLQMLTKIKEENNIVEKSDMLDVVQEIYILNEVLLTYRKERKIKVRDLEEDTCSEKTYRAIEKGKRKPNQGTYEAIVEKFNIPLEKYSFDIVTDDYEDILLVEQERKYELVKKHREAFEILKQLKEKLNMKIPKNKQFILMKENAMLYDLDKNYGMDKFNENIDRALRITIPEWSEEYENHLYTRTEMNLVCHKTLVYRMKKEPEKGIQLLKKLWDYIQESQVDNIYRGNEVLYIMVLWKNLLTDMGKYEEALEKAIEGIKLCFEYGSGAKLLGFIFERGWSLERIDHRELSKEEKNTKCAEYFQEAFCVAKMFDIKKDIGIIENYCIKKNYNLDKQC